MAHQRESINKISGLWDFKPIGFIQSVFHFKNGTPRQPSVCSFAKGSLTICKDVFNNPEHSLEGLEEFSHVWLMFVFHKNSGLHCKAKVKPPRLNGRRVGVFSTRSPHRPNAIGLSLVRLEAVRGATLFLSGLDLLDGTPVLDVKPYIPDYDCPAICPPPCSLSLTQQCPVVSSETESDKKLCECEDEIHRKFGEQDCSAPAMITAGCLESQDLHSRCMDDDAEITDFATADPSACIDAETERNVGECQVIVKDEPYSRDRTRMIKTANTPDRLTSAVLNDLHPEGSCETQTCDLESLQVKDEPSETSVSSADSGIAGASYLKSSQICKMESNRQSRSSDMRKVSRNAGVVECTNLESSEPRQNDSNCVSASGETREVTLSGLTSESGEDISTADWVSRPPVSRLTVRFTPRVLQQLSWFSPASSDPDRRLQYLGGPGEVREGVEQVLREDPRSVYRRQRCVDSLYYFVLDAVHVTCWFDHDVAEVVRIQPSSLVPQCQHS